MLLSSKEAFIVVGSVHCGGVVRNVDAVGLCVILLPTKFALRVFLALEGKRHLRHVLWIRAYLRNRPVNSGITSINTFIPIVKTHENRN
jgi:hypothetical protein